MPPILSMRSHGSEIIQRRFGKLSVKLFESASSATAPYSTPMICNPIAEPPPRLSGSFTVRPS
jgi:hypothetical protein